MSKDEFAQLLEDFTSAATDETRKQILHLLGGKSDPRALELSIKILDTTIGWELRKLAEHNIFRLSRLDGAFEILLDCLKQEQWTRSKTLAPTVLGDLKDRRAVDHLILALDKDRSPAMFCGNALQALSQIDFEKAVAYGKSYHVDILMAEDERDICDLICFTLGFAGYKLIAAENGEDALARVKIVKPALVLLDVRMPRMTGYEMCKAMKADPNLEGIPVVFLTAKGQESEVEYGMSIGAEEYLLKPFAPDQLTNRIKSIMWKFDLGIYDK